MTIDMAIVANLTLAEVAAASSCICSIVIRVRSGYLSDVLTAEEFR
jgi:hypothetical protein